MATNDALNNPLAGSTGSGQYVGDNTPTLITPNIGAATGDSINLGSSTTIDGFIDDDTMATASATTGATSESIAAFANLSRKNLIIGGNFSTAPWQRGTSFPAILTNTYIADRFRYYWAASTAVITYQKTVDAPTVSEAGIYSEHCLEADVTTGDAAIAAGVLVGTSYIVEAYDYSAIAEREFTLSFWAKAFDTGTYCVSFYNSAANRFYTTEYVINTTATWEKKTITLTADTAGTWLTSTNGVGIHIKFMMAVGSTFHGTADAWTSSVILGTSSQVNGVASASSYLRIQLIQLEAGGAATPFEIRHRETELALCQRYYFKTYDQGVTPGTLTETGAFYYRAFDASTTPTSWDFTFPVGMRSTPAITHYSPGVASTSNWYNISGAAASGAASSFRIGMRGAGIQNAQAAGDGVQNFLGIHLSASAEL